MYLRTHQWDKRESIHYEANSSSFLPNCSPQHPSLGEHCQGGGSGLLLGSGSAQSLLAQPPRPRWPSWHTQLCSPAGGTSAPVTRSPTPGKVPEPALCSNSSAPAHEPPECLLLMSFSRLCANSCAGSSLTGKLANHFQRTHHICFSRLKQEARALKSAPRPKWEL